MNRIKSNFSKLSLSNHTFIENNKTYNVKDLIKASENCEEFDLHLDSLDLDMCCWSNLKTGSFYTFLEHAKRVREANLKYPVIQTPQGYICDGWHRIAKAILQGKETIKVKRLKRMPGPVKDEH